MINKATIEDLSKANEEAWDMRFNQRDKAYELAVQIKTEAEKAGDEKNKFIAQTTLALINFWLMRGQEYLKDILEAFSYFDFNGVIKYKSVSACVAASVYEQYGEYDKAMQYALTALSAANLTNNNEIKADAHIVLAQIYSRTQDYKQAIAEIKKALEVRKIDGDAKAIASAINLLARNYVLDKKYVEGKKYYLESLGLRKANDDNAGLPWTYIGLATLYTEKEEYTKALEYYELADKGNATNEKRLKLLCLTGKGRVSFKINNAALATIYLLEAEAAAKEQRNLPFLSEICQLLSEILEHTGEAAKALTYFKQYHEINQIILGQEKTNSLKNQQILFSIEQSTKEAEIYRLKNVELKAAFDKIDQQHQELEEKNKEMVDSINYAKRLQQAILPTHEFINKTLKDNFILYLPKDIVSGDFYWAEQEGDYFFIAAADCTGHGVPGALMSVVCSNALHKVVKEFKETEPALILDKVTDVVVNTFEKNQKDVKDGMDISLCRMDLKAGEIVWVGAHNPLWYIEAGELKEIKANKQPIGKFDYRKPFTSHTIKITPGMSFYLFTDGYADQFGGPEGKKFKYKTLANLLLKINAQPMVEQGQALQSTFLDWKKEYQQVDDVCIVGFKL